MIKLTRNTAPDKLTEEFVKKGTEKYKNTKESVWNVDWLKEALLDMSNQKCAYCEGRLDLKSDYMEVEHFRDKKDYPNDVLIWENLLPSCKHCNGNKSSHDVVSEPIINPFVDVPREHIFLKSYLYKPKDELGTGAAGAGAVQGGEGGTAGGAGAVRCPKGGGGSADGADTDRTTAAGHGEDTLCGGLCRKASGQRRHGHGTVFDVCQRRRGAASHPQDRLRRRIGPDHAGYEERAQ